MYSRGDTRWTRWFVQNIVPTLGGRYVNEPPWAEEREQWYVIPPRCQRSVATPSTAGGSHITARLRGSRGFILTNHCGQGDHPCYTGCIHQIKVNTCYHSFSSSIQLWNWGRSAWRLTAIFPPFQFRIFIGNLHYLNWTGEDRGCSSTHQGSHFHPIDLWILQLYHFTKSSESEELRLECTGQSHYCQDCLSCC